MTNSFRESLSSFRLPVGICRVSKFSISLFAVLFLALMACGDGPTEIATDTGIEADIDDGDVGPTDDTGTDVAGTDVAGDGDADVGVGADDDVGSDGEGGDADSDPDDADTGPTEPPDPGECGQDYWDDYHDGSNPWDDFDIDCDELAASWDCDATGREEAILAMINQARQEEQTCGSTAYGPSGDLVMDPQLRCAARIHSWDQAGRNYYDHDTPEGLSPSYRVSVIPGPHSMAAENIFDWLTSAENIFQGWMNSAGHCRNMMCPHYTHVGIGIYEGKHTLKIIGPSVCY